MTSISKPLILCTCSSAAVRTTSARCCCCISRTWYIPICTSCIPYEKHAGIIPHTGIIGMYEPRYLSLERYMPLLLPRFEHRPTAGWNDGNTTTTIAVSNLSVTDCYLLCTCSVDHLLMNIYPRYYTREQSRHRLRYAFLKEAK